MKKGEMLHGCSLGYEEEWARFPPSSYVIDLSINEGSAAQRKEK